MPEKQDDRIEFVKGWFSDTVIREISKYKNTNGRQVVCHFDADLYSSTLFCLTAVLQKFKTFYFIFDEFYRDEVRALHNAKQAYPCEIRFIAHTKHARGQYPSRVAGLVENLTKF